LNSSEANLRTRIADACRICYDEGLCESLGPEFAGHISVRTGKNRMLMPGHLHGSGRGLKDIKPEDIIAVDLNGKLLEGKHEPVEEVFIHTSIYKARDDVKSVAHLHAQFVTAIASTSTGLIPMSLKSCYFVDTPVLDIGPTLLINEKTTSKMVEKLGNRNAVIHKGHGIVTVGKTLDEACVTAFLLEGSAKMQYISSQFGKVVPFNRSDALEFAKGQHFASSYPAFWRYYENKWKNKK
jgi:ribulose-5-phosphate 4-epimerase/fuculose-1-phosphate aldolase